MGLGIDFGTTRTIVAFADRGNYPVVSFFDTDGDPHEFFPSVAAWDQDALHFGFEALERARRGAPLLRSFKRALADPLVNADTTIAIGDRQVVLLDLLTQYLAAVGDALEHRSSLAERPTSCAVAVPAHAHGAQRFLTLEAFRRAGFTVQAMINEPSAAAFEYTHRQPRTLTSRRNRVIVYDLGGGTFDASLVKVDGTLHEIDGSVGLNHLGGDDFDEVLVQVACTKAGVRPDHLSRSAAEQLLDDARDAKEHLSPQTKRIALEVADQVILVPVADYYSAAEPLVADTMDAMDPLVGALDGGPELAEVAGIYLVGGASSLPLVPRVLRERFGRRVHRSPYPAASTAIGLAIATDSEAGYQLTDQLSRGFGVFRELDAGRAVGFDPILRNDEVLCPQSGEAGAAETVITRRYRPAHNIGCFRFVEYASLDDHGQPRGDLVPFAEVRFGFINELQDGRDLDTVPVTRGNDGHLIEERYVIDAHGIITVQLVDLDTGHQQTFALA